MATNDSRKYDRLFCLSILLNYYQFSNSKTIEVNVSARYSKAVDYNEIKTPNTVFKSGQNGVLLVKPQSFFEACALKYLTGNDIDVFDFIYFLMIACFLWWMTYDIRKEDIFSKKILTGLKWVGWSIVIYASIKDFSFFLVNFYIRQITDQQFGAQWEQIGWYKFMIAAMLFQLIPMFIQKAQQIQEEQELTI